MIRVAILGAGIGAQHLQAFLRLSDVFDVAYIIDRDAGKANALTTNASSFMVADDISAALSDPTIDLIDICLPPHLHVPVTLAALTAGKHVICEKPLATSVGDAHRVRQKAAEVSKHVFPVFQYRWGTPLAQLRHLIKHDITGTPHMAALETHWSRGADYYSVPWRGTWHGEQGGAVLGHAIHSHDLLTHFMGPVAAVSAVTKTRINDIETEDCAVINFEMTSGALATSNITLGAATNETRLRFVFEKLTVTSGASPYAPGAENWAFVARDPGAQALIDEALKTISPEPLGYLGYLESVAQTLAETPCDTVCIDDGVASVELVAAVYQAARTNSRVTLPLCEDSAFFEGWCP